jgi:hypothetical protein
MDRIRADGISRRGALRRSTAMALGAAVIWLAAPSARAQAGKLAKDAVKYVDRGDAPGKDCDDCMHYIAPATPRDPATCRIVDGAISPHGHCIAFTPKPKTAP